MSLSWSITNYSHLAQCPTDISICKTKFPGIVLANKKIPTCPITNKKIPTCQITKYTVPTCPSVPPICPLVTARMFASCKSLITQTQRMKEKIFQKITWCNFKELLQKFLWPWGIMSKRKQSIRGKNVKGKFTGSGLVGDHPLYGHCFKGKKDQGGQPGLSFFQCW